MLVPMINQEAPARIAGSRRVGYATRSTRSNARATRSSPRQSRSPKDLLIQQLGCGGVVHSRAHESSGEEEVEDSRTSRRAARSDRTPADRALAQADGANQPSL